MEIILANPMGFCSGVSNAIGIAEKICKLQKNPICIGPIIHNKQMMDALKEKGLQEIRDVSELSYKNFDCIFTKAHGMKQEELALMHQFQVPVYDLTCAKVLFIHDIIKKDVGLDKTIILIGDEKHPEIEAMKSLIPKEKCVVIADQESLEDYPWSDELSYSIVFQTTYNEQKASLIISSIGGFQQRYDIVYQNTICSATKKRQQGVALLAPKVDAFIVIGSRKSSNATKLYEIAKGLCKNAIFIEQSDEIDPNWVINFDRIGLSAGASTPDFIIKEVLTKVSAIHEMTSQNIEEMDMEKLLDNEELSMKKIRTGAIVSGTVIGVKDNEITVNVGYKADGIVSSDELSNDSSVRAEDICKVGDEIEVFVKKLNDGDGNVILSLKRVEHLKGWEILAEKYENKEQITAKVTQSVKGGLIALYEGLRCFIPASHISIFYVKDLEQFVGQELLFDILEIEKRNRKIILSRKKILQQETAQKMEEAWANIEVGKKMEGIVKRFTNFGAFIDLGGVDGLIHISELSWGRIKHPSDVLKIGDTVLVEVLDMDREKGKISLGYKHNIVNPWDVVSENYEVGQVLQVKVLRIAEFGAFVEVEPGLEGLIHISQLSSEHVEKVEDVVEVNQSYEAKILDINPEEKRLALSIKALSLHQSEQNHVEEKEETEPLSEPQVCEEDTDTPEQSAPEAMSESTETSEEISDSENKE